VCFRCSYYVGIIVDLSVRSEMFIYSCMFYNIIKYIDKFNEVNVSKYVI
jgi:hypothetical protein